MDDNRILNEEAISDIILCEPITRKGKEALNRLGLTTEDISPSFFYDNLRIASKYDEGKAYEKKTSDPNYGRNHLYYQYTVDHIQFEELQDRLKKFNSRFYSNSPNEYPLFMLGVAGNGKSIEINRQIRKITSGESEYEPEKVYFDLEDAFTKVTYGVTYKCPSNTPLWLFCIKLLDGIMQYIRSCHFLCSEILTNFNNILVKENLANAEQRELFQNIGNFCPRDNDSETKVFTSLKSFLSSIDVCDNIEILLEILMWIMYCSAPDKKQYIIVDNIEQYIKLDDLKIQIPNSDISKLYSSINNVITNVLNDFDRIEKDLGWKAFKIIIVLRRTSLGLLGSEQLHSPVKVEQNITDITGYFQIPDIWERKKKFIWNDRLSSKFNDAENEKIIKIVENIMNDGTKAIGTDYQSIIAPLMSYGIRRNAKAQAHAAYSTYKILTNGREENISFNEFNDLMCAISRDNTSVRYMFRRALIESQFKWSISSGRQDRWKNLGIGNLTGKKEHIYHGKRFIVEGVEYRDAGCVTLMRRILTYLSYYPEENEYANSRKKSVADMFMTRSLFDLIQGVLVNPQGYVKISRSEFLSFARVLIALSDMSNGDTKSAPYVILSVKNSNFHRTTDETVLAELLNKIWEGGPQKSMPEEEYNKCDFGARITDAGNSFLLDWQASFSFIASLHCFTIPSLFFLKDVTSIKYVIETVYNASASLCEKYEAEARCFCGENFTLQKGKYLPRYNNKGITYRQRIQELHMNHLQLYRDFIGKNYKHIGISIDDMNDLTSTDSGYISKYIDMYNRWKTNEEVPECF